MHQDEDTRDFDRAIWCLLGLVYDSVSLESARDSIYSSASSGRRCFISTPNLNFTVSALADAEFRDTVMNSDLSLLDGVPLLWVARLLGTGLREKVSGSDLFQALWHRPASQQEKLKVYFFGGMHDVAERACKTVNASGEGIACVGSSNPGFGTIEDLSTQATLDEINRSGADFLVVALGARKGQIWIARNYARLSVPVVCHLGAVLNFVAGSVKRAPAWMQSSGLEWLWRVIEEPALWRRYVVDGLHFIRLIFTRVLPYALWRRLHADQLREGDDVIVRMQPGERQTLLWLEGKCLVHTIGPLRSAFAEVSTAENSVMLDLAKVPVIDGAFLGLCLILKKNLEKTGTELDFRGLNSDLVRIFRWNCVDNLL